MADTYKVTTNGGIPLCRRAKIETAAIEAAAALAKGKRVFVSADSGPARKVLSLYANHVAVLTDSLGEPVDRNRWPSWANYLVTVIPSNLLALSGEQLTINDENPIVVNEGAGRPAKPTDRLVPET